MPAMSGAGIGALLIMAVTVYWIFSSDVLQRLWRGITTDRALALGGFGMGLVYGEVVLKMLVGFVGGFGVLAVGDVIDIGPMQFALVVVGIIAVLAYTRDEMEDD